jgi:cation:H+ antiporter
LASIAIYILIFVVSLAVLLLSSDKFIDAAERIGLSFGVSPFIIGITIVAFGTSLPELATSIASVLNGTSEIVIGNVVGSNITNILLVLGLTAMIGKEFKLDFNIMDIDMPLLIISAFLTYYLAWDLNFSMFDACISLAALAIFLANSVQGQQKDKEDRPKLNKIDYLWLIGGAIGVFAGANYVIYAIINISQIMAISPDLIALTLVALGTSLPEIVVSISAARKGKHAIAVGNVLGSNIFNSYAVMGIPRLFGPLAISESVLSFSIPFMIVMTILFAIITFSNRISRYEGMMLVLFYVYYIVQLVQNNG